MPALLFYNQTMRFLYCKHRNICVYCGSRHAAHSLYTDIDWTLLLPLLPALRRSNPLCVYTFYTEQREVNKRTTFPPWTGCVKRAREGRQANRGKEFPGDTVLLSLACCLDIVSLRSGWALTQPSQCIMGDQREPNVGHHEGADAWGGGESEGKGRKRNKGIEREGEEETGGRRDGNTVC